MHIFVFGDSNSWGYLGDGTGNKYEKRWPLVMLENLKTHTANTTLSEDSLPGRTTAIDDPQDGDFLNGTRSLKTSLLAHSPIDHSIIMLGTNDLKARYNRSPKEISLSLIKLAEIVLSSKTYEKALSLLSRLELEANNPQNRLYAQSSLMKTYFQLEN